MKKTLSGIVLLTSISLSGLSYADDYTQYSNDDLFGMRDQVRTMDDASRDAYRTERKSRMSSMDQTERDSRFSNMGASGQRNMDQMGGGRGRGGGGGGGGGQHRYGQNNDSGSGSQNRYRYQQNSDSSSQYGYGGGSGGGQYGGGGGGRRYGGGR